MRPNAPAFLTVACLSLACAANAQEAPLAGRIYNFALNERIHYDCSVPVEGTINCRFTSAKVSPVLSEEDAAERRAAELADIDDPGAIEEFAEVTCDAAGRMQADLADGVLDDVDGMLPEDAERLFRMLRSACGRPDRAAVEALVDFGLDTMRRTCLVSTLGWEATFRQNDERTWVRVQTDGPVGDGCGGVHLDRFELAEEGFLWNLARRSIASNPNGTFTSGQKCSEVYSGEEITYQWQGGDLPGRCDYIRLNLMD